MTLGEQIAKLRSERGLSQAELAETLNVSRQSISKWERDASIPELDKLVALSETFGVTIDELVKGAQSTTQAAEPEQNLPQQIVADRAVGTQKIIGFILLALGLLCGVLALRLGSVLLVAGGYLLLCSLICLRIREHAWIVIAWVTLLPALFFAPYYVGIQPWAVFYPLFHVNNGFTLRWFCTMALWMIVVLLLLATIRVFRKKR